MRESHVLRPCCQAATTWEVSDGDRGFVSDIYVRCGSLRDARPKPSAAQRRLGSFQLKPLQLWNQSFELTPLTGLRK